MRRFNAILSMTILALFVLHVVIGSLQLAGVMPGGSVIMQAAAYIMAAGIAVHAVIGVKLTADTLIAQKRAGASYFKENRLFWIRRISGFAVMLFIASHIIIFLGNNDKGSYRLNLFDIPELVSSLLLVISVLVHVVTNIRPLANALGARRFGEFIAEAAVVISMLLLAAGVGFVIYFIRWSF